MNKVTSSTAKALILGIVASLTFGVLTPTVQAAPKNLGRALVQADWLEQNLTNPDVKIIEVSTEAGLYEKGHITNAINFNWYIDLVDPVNRNIVNRANFQKLARQAGINSDSIIVLYGDRSNWFAAWGAWIFNIYGAKDVRILDGGRIKWEKDGRLLTTEVATPKAGSFSATRADKTLRAFLGRDVLPVAKKRSNVSLVDIRSPDEFNGKIFAPAGSIELAIRAGHIPNSINIPFGLNMNADGTFKTVAELKKLYDDKGIDGSKPIITTCRIGERAALSWFVLSEILGYNVKLYDGSWTEYGNTVGLPIVNNAGTIWSKP